MNYKKFNGKTNLVGNLVFQKRTEQNLSYSQLSNKLQLIGVCLYKNDLFLIEKNRRLVRDFELIALCKVLDITLFELNSMLD